MAGHCPDILQEPMLTISDNFVFKLNNESSILNSCNSGNLPFPFLPSSSPLPSPLPKPEPPEPPELSFLSLFLFPSPAPVSLFPPEELWLLLLPPELLLFPLCSLTPPEPPCCLPLSPALPLSGLSRSLDLA